jgi:hypothetical protein
MSLAALAGRTLAPTEPSEVTREQVAAFAASTGGSYEGGAAPATFPIIIAFDAIRALVDDPGTGLALARVVHGEQRFSYHRPVLPGDVLTAHLTVESVRSIAGADYIRTVTEIRDGQGEPVVTAWATLLHRGAGPDDAAPPDPGGGGRTDGPSLPPPRAPR